MTQVRLDSAQDGANAAANETAPYPAAASASVSTFARGADPRRFPYREALVTGASRGLGRAFALALQAEGVRVHGTSRDGTRLPPGVVPHALDLADAAAVDALAARLAREAPGVDLLVNNAGAGVWCPVAALPSDEAAAQFSVLLEGPARLCRAFYPRFAARGRGAVVNVASLAGAFPIPCMSLYCAAKAGLSAFTRTLMLEAAGTGVVVLDFQPGDYRTAFNDNLRKPARAAIAETDGLAITPVASASSAECKQPRDGADSAGGVGATAAFSAVREAAAWERCEAHLRAAQPPEHAARALIRALRKGRSRTVVAGSFFQATAGPLLARLLPQSAIAWFLRMYYKL